MDSLEQDLNTLRIYGRGLSRYDLQGEVDSLADDENDDEDQSDEAQEPNEQSSGVVTTDLGDLDLQGLATRILKLLKQELLFERERNR